MPELSRSREQYCFRLLDRCNREAVIFQFGTYGLDDELAPRMLEKFQREFFYAPRPDAQGYEDGASWDLGQTQVRAFHFPGHTAGHSVLLVEPEAVAFIGDIDLTGFGPYYGDACSSLHDFRRSLARLRLRNCKTPEKCRKPHLTPGW